MSLLRKKAPKLHNTSKTKLIVLNHYSDKVKDLEAIQKKLRSNLRDILFEIDSFQELQFQALKQFSVVHKTVQNDTASIHKAAQKIVSHFGFTKRKAVAIITDLSNNEIKTVSSKGDTPLEIFSHFILGFRTTPKIELLAFKEKVEYHLRYIDGLVRMYEREEVIAQYKISHKVPSGNQSRMLVDFYKRCIAERDVVLDFFLNEVEERAIWRANASLIPLHVLSNPFRDFPYKCWRIYSDEYFDYRKVSRVVHRVRGLDALSEHTAIELYGKKPALFYKKLFKVKPVQQIFTNIDQHRKHLPFQHDREPIFVELKKLFTRKQWIAFFALALPQVEGLFTEMLHAENPEVKGKSLTEKVEQVRPLHFASDYYFDYYQYILPELRNQFAHIGYSEDFKIKSFDLLTDLEHILSVFVELNNPLVQVNQLIRKREIGDFQQYSDYAKFFVLLKKLHGSQLRKLRQEIDAFVTDFLLVDCDIEATFHEVLKVISQVIHDLTVSIERLVGSAEIAADIADYKIPELKELVSKHKENFEFYTKYNSENFEKISQIKAFVEGVNKFMPNWNSSIKSDFLQQMNEFQKSIFIFGELGKIALA